MVIKSSLKNYILIQILSLFALIACTLFIYSSLKNKQSIEDFSNEYMNQHSIFVMNEFCNVIDSCTKATDIFASWLDTEQSSKNPFEQKTDYSNILSKKPDKRLLSFFKQIVYSFDGIIAMQVANSNGNFWQIRHYTEENNIPLSKIKMQTTDKSIPLNTAYVFRMTTGKTASGRTEDWSYYSEDGNMIANEIDEFSQYNGSQRNWYINALSKKYSHFISDIYKAGSTIEVPVLTVASTLRNSSTHQEEKCVVSSDISSKYLEKLLKSKSFSKNNIVCIIDDNTDIILNSQNNENPKNDPDIYDKNDVLEKTINMYHNNNGKTDYFSFYQNETEYVANIIQFPDEFELQTGKNWKILIVAPMADLEEKFSQFSVGGNIIYIILMLTALMQIICIARRLADPITELTDEALKIYKFDFSSKFTTDSKILEIKNLDNAISSMRISLKSFTKYMPKSLVIKLLNKKSSIDLGGETKNVAIFFSDIESFTSVSEKLPAPDLALHISDYFEHLTKILMDEKATIDKYIGDSIMAFWGAPDEDDNRAFNACRAALLCQSKLKDLNKEWSKNNLPILNTRMGIHLGDAVVGNIGSSDRMNYTLLGDSVNLASRLEGTNKIYKTRIIISQSVFQAINNDFLTIPLDIVMVKGKDEPVKIYELIGQLNSDMCIRPTDEQKEFAKNFNRAFEFYINMNWEAALAIYNKIEHDEKYDTLINMYMERCNDYLKNPPDENWNGSFRLTTK